MRITIVLGAFLPVPPVMGGAVEKIWFALGQEFARRGHEVIQISRARPEFARTEMRDGVRHLRVRGYDTPRSLFWLKALDFLYSIRARRALPKADIVVTNTFWLPMFLRNEKRGKVYVHVARFPKGQMRFYQHCARLQAPSQCVARAIIAEVPSVEAKVKVIPYPRPAPSGRDAPVFANRARKILYVGRVHPEKGVHLLLDAFRQLPSSIAQTWKLSIVGPWESKLGGGGEGYWNQLRAAATKLGNSVRLQGAIFDAGALKAEFTSAQLFVYPSLAETGETFGLAPLEAMAHGCAVLVSNLDCFHDFIRDGETGFIFDHRLEEPVKALQRKMETLLNDNQSRARVAEVGWRKSNEYLLTEVADRFLADFQLVTS